MSENIQHTEKRQGVGFNSTMEENILRDKDPQKKKFSRTNFPGNTLKRKASRS